MPSQVFLSTLAAELSCRFAQLAILDGSDNMNTAISSRDERAFSAPALLVAGAFFMGFSTGR
ncbi:hypothetical protein LNP25_28865 [Klebsiella variicola subsp. variicola]|nr:hypothetical protein [Klebsiella variicola subsp. variicola]